MSAAVDKSKVPWWVSNLIVPLVNLSLALFVSALFIFIAGENPVKAVKLIIYDNFKKRIYFIFNCFKDQKIKNYNKKKGCVFAANQTSARGTKGKKWISVEGNFFGSIFLDLKNIFIFGILSLF